MNQRTSIPPKRMTDRFTISGLLCALIFSAASLDSAAAESSGKLSYNRDVRPILSDKCFHCHGPDAKTRKADLRLDTAEGAFAVGTEPGSVAAIVPGRPEDSSLIHRVRSTDESEIMPPPESKKTLTAAQIEILNQWIREGAEYQKHWSFESIGPVTPPVSEAVAHPVDAFLNVRLAQARLTVQPEADRETLIRRVAFTLTGLPPTIAEVDQYLADTADGAYERMVDRYLQSPRYGEEMARHWLDVARYADTHGLHLDNERQMWAYRDWVIKAFNDNLPFDQFTVWQVAGDLFPSPTTEQLVATGFNRCNVTTSEGGSIPEEFVYRYAVERTTTVSQAWLGLTTGCAVCHDHKYDPITSKEFYSLYAFFNNAADPAMDGNTSVTMPFLKLPTEMDRSVAVKESAREQAARERMETLIAALSPAASTTSSTDAAATSAEAKRAIRDVLLDDVVPPGTVSRSSSRNPVDWVTEPDFGASSGRRVIRQQFASSYNDQFEFRLRPIVIPHDGIIEVSVRFPAKDIPESVSIGPVSGGRAVTWVRDQGGMKLQTGTADSLPPEQWNRLVIKATDLGLNPGDRLTGVRLSQTGGIAYWDNLTLSGLSDPAVDPQESLAAWRTIQGTTVPPELPAELHAIIQGGPEKSLTDEESLKLTRYYRSIIARPASPELTEHRAIWEAARTARIVAEEGPPGTFIYRDLEQPRESFVMVRGQYDAPGERVEPAVPAALPQIQKPEGVARLNRMDLAKWLVAPENPLTARVSVNRFWQQVFGTGLVKTSYDFGTQGESPSHPELLDWLSVRFRDHGWDVRQLMKLLLTSDAFKRHSSLTADVRTADPGNRLLARGPRFRLDAEQVRDNALYVSGLIDLQMGGRGVRPYQPSNIWEPVGYSDSNTRFYMQDRGEALYRRSIYAFLKRTAPPPFMSNFDAPNREQVCMVRERSNTPLQALQLMNDIQHFEAARGLAERILTEAGTSTSDRLTYLYRVVLSRRPSPDEFSLLTSAVERQRELYTADPAAAEKAILTGESKPRGSFPAIETAAWTMVANLVLNLDEAVNRN
jgi:hypothetical protein